MSERNILEFYTKDDLQKHFGHSNPSLEERIEHFKFLWFYFSADKELDMCQISGNKMSKVLMSEIRKELGPFNCVIRGYRMRFRYEEDLLVTKLKYTNYGSAND